MVTDVNGLELGKGDMVAPLTGDFKGRVCALKLEDGAGFVCIRPSHRPYSKGIWYSADHVQRLAIAKVRAGDAPAADAPAPSAKVTPVTTTTTKTTTTAAMNARRPGRSGTTAKAG
jgi:hypothetical protein